MSKHNSPISATDAIRMLGSFFILTESIPQEFCDPKTITLGITLLADMLGMSQKMTLELNNIVGKNLSKKNLPFQVNSILHDTVDIAMYNADNYGSNPPSSEHPDRFTEILRRNLNIVNLMKGEILKCLTDNTYRAKFLDQVKSDSSTYEFINGLLERYNLFKLDAIRFLGILGARHKVSSVITSDANKTINAKFSVVKETSDIMISTQRKELMDSILSENYACKPEVKEKVRSFSARSFEGKLPMEYQVSFALLSEHFEVNTVLDIQMSPEALLDKFKELGIRHLTGVGLSDIMRVEDRLESYHFMENCSGLRFSRHSKFVSDVARLVVKTRERIDKKFGEDFWKRLTEDENPSPQINHQEKLFGESSLVDIIHKMREERIIADILLTGPQTWSKLKLDNIQIGILRKTWCRGIPEGIIIVGESMNNVDYVVNDGVDFGYKARDGKAGIHLECGAVVIVRDTRKFRLIRLESKSRQ